jgi:hypothetical protein
MQVRTDRPCGPARLGRTAPQTVVVLLDSEPARRRSEEDCIVVSVTVLDGIGFDEGKATTGSFQGWFPSVDADPG